MAYEKTVWQKGMVLTAENLNKIENALEGITSVVSVGTDASGLNTTNTTTNNLTVSGTSNLGTTNISGATTIGTQETAANLTVNGNITGTNEISGNTLTVAGLLSVGNSTAACTINNQGQIIASTIASIGSITASTITSSDTITGESLTINQDAVFKKNVILKNGEDIWMSLDSSGIIYAPNITFGASSSSTYITNSIFNHPHIAQDSFTGAYEKIVLGYDSSTITLKGNTNVNTISANGNYILSNRTDTSGNTAIKSNYTIGAGQGGFWIKENITSPTTFNETSNYTLLSLSHEVDANSKVYPSIYIGSSNNTTNGAVHNIFLEAAGQVVLQGGAENGNGVVIGSNLYLSSGKTLKIGVSGSDPVELSAADITYLHQLQEAQNGGE